MLYPSVGSRGRYLDSPGHCLSSCGVSYIAGVIIFPTFSKKPPGSARVKACRSVSKDTWDPQNACQSVSWRVVAALLFFYDFRPEKIAKLTVSRACQLGNVEMFPGPVSRGILFPSSCNNLTMEMPRRCTVRDCMVYAYGKTKQSYTVPQSLAISPQQLLYVWHGALYLKANQSP